MPGTLQQFAAAQLSPGYGSLLGTVGANGLSTLHVEMNNIVNMTPKSTTAGIQALAGFNVAQIAGTTYFLDGAKLRRISPLGYCDIVAGTNTNTDAQGTGSAAGFNSPTGLCTDGTNLYVATSSHRIMKVVPGPGNTSVVTFFAGTGSTGATDNTTGTSATLNAPKAICCNAAGTFLFFTDAGNTLRRVSLSGLNPVVTLAGNAVAADAQGTGASGGFNVPKGICITSDSTAIYIATGTGNRIMKVTPGSNFTTDAANTGVVTFFAGSGSAGSLDATGTAATFQSLTGLTIDTTNTFLYVGQGQGSGNSLRKISIPGAVVTTIANTTSAVTTTDASLDNYGSDLEMGTVYGLSVSLDGTTLIVLASGGGAVGGGYHITFVDIATLKGTNLITFVAGNGSGSVARNLDAEVVIHAVPSGGTLGPDNIRFRQGVPMSGATVFINSDMVFPTGTKIYAITKHYTVNLIATGVF